MAKTRLTSNRVELAGSDKKAAPGATAGAPREAGEILEILVRIRRNQPLPTASAKPGQFMTHAQYAAGHSAASADLNAVKNFAKRFDLKVNAVFPVQRSILLKGSLANVCQAFQVELKTYHLPNGTSCRGREGKIFIPANLREIIVGVFGLDDRPVVHSHVRWSPLRKAAAGGPKFQTTAPTEAFFPNQLAELYNFPAGTDGRGQTVGIVEIGGGFTKTDLDTYFKAAGVSNPPSISVATVPGGAGNAPAPKSADQPDIEVSLDMEVVGSAAPGANIVMYFGKDGSTKQTLLAVQSAVHDASASPSVLSLSWGGEEYDTSLGGGTAGTMEEQYQNNMNDLFQTAQTLGITVCVSSGDSASAGAPANAWDGHAHVSFPASSPWVLAVGGTHIIKAAGTNPQEETWHPEANVGSGGGISRYFPRPTYQQKAVTQTAVNPAGGTGRGVPDVSADAAQESGYRVLADGQWYQGQNATHPPIGGTSCAAPLWAALIARLNQGLNTKLGFVNPLLYQLPTSAAAFHDITQGNNGDYKAGHGWDACTGLGTPNGQNLLNALQSLVAPAAANSIATRSGAAAAQKPLRKSEKKERPSPEQISGEIARKIILFDSDDSSTYFAGTIVPAAVSRSAALAAIKWPSGQHPVPVPPSTAPVAEAPLTHFDYLVVTWTTEEAKALADVLTPGFPSKTAWYHYTHNFTSEFVPLISPGAPSVEDSHRLGSFFPITMAGKSVLCFKSELHFSQDGPKMPILKLWQQLIAEVSPKLVITTGTAGGIGSAIQLGDVVVAPAVRFDCTTKFASQPFAKAVYPCSPLQTTSLSVAAGLFAANAGQLPASSRLPAIFTQPAPGVPSADVVTSDFFAYDDTQDRYGLQGLGAACDEGDATLGLAISQLASPPPKWVSVRNASDPQIQDAGLTKEQAYQKATGYYAKYGYWTTVDSAITCWSIILDN